MTTLAGSEITIIGGGFGGLSTAAYLAEAGADVTVLEKNEQLGGRASVLEAEGFRFDMGPSWYLMPDVFERFFDHLGRAPEDYYELERLDPHYRIFFKDGDRIDVPADREAAKGVFESYEDGAGETLEAYLDEAEYTYDVGMEHFVYTDRSRLRDFVDMDVVRHANGLSLLGSMQDHVEDYFEHPKLQQIVQYSLVFLGGAPNNTPALYNLMSHVDFNLGVWYPEGGIGAVVDAMADLGRELGVEYRTNAPVTQIKGRAGGFRVEIDGQDGTDGSEGDGGGVECDYVVSDADYRHTEQELLDERKRGFDADYWESRTYAPSAFLLYLGVEGEVPELAHHTLVLPTDWEEHFAEIFDDPTWPNDPAYYVCVPSKTDDTVSPDGHTALFVLVPIAPGLDDSPRIRKSYRNRILADIADNTGTDLRDRIVFEESFSVGDFADRYNATKGTALGIAHTLRQTAAFRPPHRSKAVDGLYFTGAYTNPGIGVPMCLIGGEHAATKLIEDHGE